MYTKLFSLSFLFAALIAVLSCNKSTQFGGDELNDQTLNSTFTDTVAIQMRMLAEDSVNTSDISSTAEYLLCGQMNDPVLGLSSATIYTGLQLASLNADFTNAKIDSVVMYLGVDPLGVYGDTTQTLDFEVTLLDEHPARTKVFYSNQSLPVKTAPEDVIGRASWFPTPRLGMPIIDSTTAVRDSGYGAWFRIPIDTSFGGRIMRMDSLTLNTDSIFYKQIKGVQIKSKTPGAILGLDLNDRTFSRITLYYTKDSSQRVFNVQFVGENKFSHYERTPSNFITDRVGTTITNDLVALQGLAGYKLEVEIPHIQAADKKKWVVNTADLILYSAASVPNDNLSKYKEASQLYATISVGDTTVAFAPDVSYSLVNTGSSFALFGGAPKSVTINGLSVKEYKFSIPSLIQDMIKGTEKQKFYLNLYPVTRTGERVIFHSPGPISPYKARLNVRYTEIE